MASTCAWTDRVEDGARYIARARALFDDARYEWLPPGTGSSMAANAYLSVGRPEAWVEFCRAEIGWGTADEDSLRSRANLVCALVFAGQADEAAALTRDVLRAAEATELSLLLGAALTGYGLAAFETDPAGVLDAMRRQDVISRELGSMPGSSRSMLARAEAAYGTPEAAFDACEQGILAYAESGDRRAAITVLSVLASLLHRLGSDEAAAVLAGAGASPTVATFAEVAASIEHLRDTLGAETFESLTARGGSMETNAMFRYALQQIEEARSAL